MHSVHIFDRLRYNIEDSVDYYSGEPIPLDVIIESVKEDVSDLYSTPPFDTPWLVHIINIMFISILHFINRKATGVLFLKEVALIPLDFYHQLDNTDTTYKVGIKHHREPDKMYVVEGSGIYSPYRGKQYLIPRKLISYLRGEMGLSFDEYNPLIIDVCPAGAPLYGTYIRPYSYSDVFVRYVNKHAHKKVYYNEFKQSNFKKKANTSFSCCSCQAIRINRRHENQLRGYEHSGKINHVHIYTRKQHTD